MGTQTSIYLPDGQQQRLPVAPRTWVDAAPGVPGDALRARLVATDASSTVMWHRQRPIFQGFQSLVQSIPNSTFTVITGLSELVDNWSGHSDTTNTGRYYAPNTSSATTNGDWYLITGYIPFNSGDATSVFYTALRDTGSATIIEGSKIPSNTGHGVTGMVLDLMQLNGHANEYVELLARQLTGVAVNTIVVNKSSTLTVRWAAADQAWTGITAPAMPAAPHTWVASDVYTGSATGAGKVPMNTELRDMVSFLNNPPAARLTSLSGGQTIPTGATWTSVNWTTAGKSLDSYGGWNVANPSRYTCQRAGLYFVAGYVSVGEPGANVGYRAVQLLQTFAAGGSLAYAGWSTAPATAGTSGTAIYAVATIRMAVGDYVETQMQHTQGAVLNINTGVNNCSRMIAVWMAA